MEERRDDPAVLPRRPRRPRRRDGLGRLQRRLPRDAVALRHVRDAERTRDRHGALDWCASIEEWAKDDGVDEVYLHVTTSVPRARAFYEKVGFRPTGEQFTMERDSSLTLDHDGASTLTDDELRVERVSADQLHELRRRVLRDDDPAIYHPDPRDDDETSLHYGGFLGTAPRRERLVLPVGRRR